MTILREQQPSGRLLVEANVKSKIQAFHDTLGEDAQYLTDEEEVTTHELFGEELYERLNDAGTYEGGEPDEGPSELKYERLDRNKQAFEYSTSEEADSSGPSGGLSNEERVMRRLRAKEVKNCKRLTDRDDEFRREGLQAFITGVIPESVLKAQRKRRSGRQKGRREVILSAHLQVKQSARITGRPDVF